MTNTISVPRELLLELRDSANDCYNNEVRRYKDDRRRIIYKALVDKADAILAQPAQDGWIPVSERLPEIATDVLVYGVNHGSASYTVAGLFSGEWASQETEETTRFEPTHWMPLPSVPKGGE